MDGMEAIEFTPPGRLLRFLEDSDMNDVYPMENKIHSLPYQDLEISGSNDQTVNIIYYASLQSRKSKKYMIMNFVLSEM